MSMVFCSGCGKKIHESAMNCPHCGAPQQNTLSDTIPDAVKGWSWGGFLLSPFWAIGNRTWIGLLALIPYLGFIMSIVLGIKGREWAWKNGNWKNIEHFKSVQKQWTIWSLVIYAIIIPIFFILILMADSISAAGY